MISIDSHGNMRSSVIFKSVCKGFRFKNSSWVFLFFYSSQYEDLSRICQWLCHICYVFCTAPSPSYPPSSPLPRQSDTHTNSSTTQRVGRQSSWLSVSQLASRFSLLKKGFGGTRIHVFANTRIPFLEVLAANRLFQILLLHRLRQPFRCREACRLQGKVHSKQVLAKLTRSASLAKHEAQICGRRLCEPNTTCWYFIYWLVSWLVSGDGTRFEPKRHRHCFYSSAEGLTFGRSLCIIFLSSFASIHHFPVHQSSEKQPTTENCKLSWHVTPWRFRISFCLFA